MEEENSKKNKAIESSKSNKVQFGINFTGDVTGTKTSSLPVETYNEERSGDGKTARSSVVEMDALIDKIKKYTVLYGLTSEDWQALDTLPLITFFEDLNKEIVTIYFDNTLLSAKLGFPESETDFIFYFMKRKGIEITQKNFNEEILFGSTDFSVDGWILKFVQEVYGPYFFSSQKIPNSVKNDACTALHNFLSKLTIVHYEKLGLTMLYLPNDGLDLTSEDAVKDVNLLKRWEDVVAVWIKQIESVLHDKDICCKEEFNNPMEIFSLWFRRLENLYGIEHQLNLPTVVKIIQVLHQAGSTFTDSFVTLVAHLMESIEQAKYNLCYLELLEGPCNKLVYITSPSEIPEIIPDIMMKIRTIWAGSSYFSTRDRMMPICKSVSNCLLEICKAHINLDEIVEGKTKSVMTLVEESSEGLLKYMLIYKKYSNAFTKYSDLKWDLDEKALFQDCEAFLERCRDILEICRDMIYYARLDETSDITKPMFAGFCWEKYEKIMDQVEEKSKGIFQWMYSHKQIMLDTRALEWNNIILKYRQEIVHVETIIRNLANVVFEDLDSVERGVFALHSFYNFMEKPSMKAFFQKKVAYVLEVFNNEIISVKTELAQPRLKCPSDLPELVGPALFLNSRMEVLKHEYDFLKSVHWIPYDEFLITIKENYEALELLVIERKKELYDSWCNQIDMNFEQRLNRPIIAVSQDNPGKLIPNYDEHLKRLYSEIKYWKIIGFDVSPALQSFYSKCNDYNILYNCVYAFTRDYNMLYSVLSDSELVLFKELLLLIDNRIYPTLSSISWLSPSLTHFMTECSNDTLYLRESIKEYKEMHLKLREICHDIGTVNLFNIKKSHCYSFDELLKEQKMHRDSVIGEMVIKYKRVIGLIAVIHNIFEEHLTKMTKQWMDYLEKIENMLVETFKFAAFNSMEYYINVLICKQKHFPDPLFNAKVHLKNEEVQLDPTLEYISEKLILVMPGIIESFELVPRILSKFQLVKVQKVPIFVDIEGDIRWAEVGGKLIKEIENTFERIEDYITSWVPFHDMWHIDKDDFMRNYEMGDPSLQVMIYDIQRFVEFAANSETVISGTTISFLRIDAIGIKESIIEHCLDWQNRFCDCLTRMTYKRLLEVDEKLDNIGDNLEFHAENLEEVEKIRKIIKEIQGKITSLEEKFPEIENHFDALDKYELPVDPEMKSTLDGLYEKSKKIFRILAEEEYLLDKKTVKFGIHNDENIQYSKKIPYCCMYKKFYQDELRSAVIKEVDNLKKEAEELLIDFLNNGPYTSEWEATDALNFLKNVRLKCKSIREKESQFEEDFKIFNITLPVLFELDEIDKEIVTIELVWEVVNEIDLSWGKKITSPFRDVKGDELESKVVASHRKIVRLHRELKEKGWEILDFMKLKVEKMRHNLPVIKTLNNPCLRERHWNKIKKVVQIDFDHLSDSFTLESIDEYKLIKFYEQISDISNSATMELNIEQGLINIKTLWDDTNLDIVPHKIKGIYRLKVADEIFTSIEENQVTLAAMKSTRFVEPFIQDVEYWEKALTVMVNVLEMFLMVQRQYLYLENIFLGEDIRKQLPEESGSFDMISSEWKTITSRMYNDKNALTCTTFPGLLKTLTSLNVQLESIQKSLEEFLEIKRHIFPRFYFISNDDLLEILGHSKNPDAVQPHIKKCFDNIYKLKLNYDPFEALGMYSADGEYVDFHAVVPIVGAVEGWLNTVVTSMRDTLKYLLKLCCVSLRKNLNKRDKWIKEWPGQVCICASQMQWTIDCTRNLHICKIRDSKKPLKKLRKKQNQMLSKFSDAIRGDLTKLQRLKIVSLVTIEVHARDVIDKLYKAGCKDVSAFEWLSQLRFAWEKDVDSCVVRQTNTSFVYGYEYLGNSGRLAITPLTDRCYITLTTALHLHRGGSPKGPAGTGKTETVKDLGKSLGSYVIVVNCSEGLDYKSMGHMFSGLAQTGAWGCFDEFNRINIEVLSVVAQQILSILQALGQGKKSFVFESQHIKLEHSCGIFITMNPGYAGRTELPDNLKSMFRPISMIVPDSCLIAEIILFGEGFRETRLLAKKVFTLYSLAIQQLSKQDHYDFGLRGMVALLRYAGRKRRMFSNYPDEEVILLAMKDMNEAKFTSNDLPLFEGITSDLFPGVKTPVIDYEELSAAVERELKENGYQPIPVIVTKVIQLYETKISRHSVMIIGRTGSGKSVTWKTLQGSLSQLSRENIAGYNLVKEYPMNPKALSLGELYGEFNLSTGEWLDGVLSAIMRVTCSDESPDEKWIVFDGPVDAVWIENMNSVMDDNKVLTLINSDRISMPNQVSLLFEVDDLSVASPATVSRCGMVYNDYKDLGWKPYATSWLDKNPDKDYVEEIKRFMDRYIRHILEFKRLHCKEIVPLTEISLVSSLCKLLECFSTPENGMDSSKGDVFKTVAKQWFLFCMVWSVCSGVDEDGRKKIDSYIRELEGMFPLKDTVYEYFIDQKSKSFLGWETMLKENHKFNLSLPFYKIVIPTVDTLRFQYLISSLLNNGYPVLLVGPVGTGKTSIMQEVLHSLDSDKYSLLTINMSAQTTSNNVQDFIISKMDKRSKGIYLPITGNKLIAFMDDFNMPAKEVYGAQPPLELIRQWIDYGFWYNREKQTPMYLSDMLLMAAMGPPGGGRNMISGRLISCFNVMNMTFPSVSQIERIFGTMIFQKLHDFDDDVKLIGSSITQATITLYDAVVTKMLPTPTKIHYLFSLRDISKVFQGLLRGHKDSQTSKNLFLRLWVHECYRVFFDRLIDTKDREWFDNQISIQLGDYFDLTFHAVCPGKISPIFGDFANESRIYEDFSDFSILKKKMEKLLNDYNASPGTVAMDLVLFRDAVEHVTHITRVLSQPRGNMLLIGIGGSGRQSLARFASFICEYEFFQIEIRKQYRLQEFREDLKNLYQKTGIETIETTFLFSDSQVVEENFLEIINNILSSGEVPNLYKSEEFEEVKNSLQAAAIENKIGLTTAAIFDFFIERVRDNLHIILCMSPIGSAFRNRIRQYPAMVNCTTLDWYLSWPEEALLEVANKSLSRVKLNITEEPGEEVLRKSISSIFASIHYSVYKCSERMLSEMKRHNYVTATNYLELVSGYINFLQKRRKELSDSANKLRNGLLKIDETREKIEVMSVELADAQVKVTAFQQECDDYLVVIAQKKRDTDEQQKSVTVRSKKIMQEEAACKKLADIAQADLDEAMPVLEEAMKALDALNKKDLSEIKSYGRPPHKVEMVMEAVMILKTVEPTWAEAKRQLGDPNFLIQLRDFDKDNITDKTLKKIALYTTNEEFDPEKVGVVSVAAKSLCMWVRAIEKYGKIYRIVAPKRAKLNEANENLREKQAILMEAQAKLDELNETLNRLKKDYDEKLANKEELRKKAEALQMKLDRAAMLVSGLSEEKERWTLSVEYLDEKCMYLPGDCLIATAFIAYMGPFVSHYREELINSWLANVKRLDVPHSPDYSVVTFLEDPATVREWNILGLPHDDFSTENGIIVTRGRRWPLIIDPQSQALKWLRAMESSKGTLSVIDLQQADFMKVLELAIQHGTSVLLKNVQEELDPLLTPILNKSLVIQGGLLLLKMSDKVIQYNENFRFFITTKLGNPHYPPEISTKTTLVNFAVKEQGLEAQLLGILVRKERPELEEQKDSLVTNIAEGKKLLKSLEDEILRLLNEAEGSLLDDVHLINTLQTSKSTSMSVKEQLEVSEKTEIEIDSARELYRPSAQRASILFFVLNDMGRIDPMYQFSLDSYLHLFVNSIEKSPRKSNLEERIECLNEYHTYAMYRNTCRGLFERHKLLFSFHMCIKIMEARGEIIPSEYNFLLKGGVVLDHDDQMDNPCPGWLSDESWDNITELDKLGGFHGVISSFEQYSRDWHNWYIATEPENTPLVEQWGEICTEFQRMLFVRSLRPDRITFCATSFVIKNIGPRFVEPPVLDMHAVLEDSNAMSPLIFVLSPGVDPTSALLQLSESVGMDKNINTLSLGQGQAPIATNLISTGIKNGNWVFLANCHLSLSWMPELDKIVEELPNADVDPRFRLWLSSSPHPDFPISILQAATKMTTEPPKGIKANMTRLYQLLKEEQFTLSFAPVDRYKRLLFSLCFFHSILLERKKFQQLGWNVLYSFNDSDFEVSENLLYIYLNEYANTPWDALKYLIASVTYGGHVTDDWDRRLLHTYINLYFTDDALNTQYYRLSSLPTYYIPRDGSLQSYKDYITVLPNVDHPEVFGQHPNADITSLINESRCLFETLLSLQTQSADSSDDTSEDKVTQLASEVLSKLPEPIDYETCEKLIGENKNPLDVVLLQEISRYNHLLVTIKLSLEELQKGIKGLVVMSSGLEEIYVCMNDGRVPPEWLRAYPSLKLLGSWTRDLVQRVNHFSQWATTLRVPILFWLAAYTFPTGLLTAVLQTSARQGGISVDSLSWDFSVVSQDESLITQRPDEGIYVRGLYLEGAGWNKKNLCLAEPLSMQLVCPLPVLHFKPVDQHKKRTKGIYVCPCYYYPERCGGGSRPSFVVAVELKSGAQNADHWVKRGTAILLSLA